VNVPAPTDDVVAALSRAFVEHPRATVTPPVQASAGHAWIALAMVAAALILGVLLGDRAGGGFEPGWWKCLVEEVVAGSISVAVFARWVRRGAPRGDWAAAAATGAMGVWVVLFFACKAPPTAAHFIAVHAAGVAAAALLAVGAHVVIATRRPVVGT
jgi:hypothetical protein